MKSILLIINIIFLPIIAFAQIINPALMAVLPDSIHESSGIEVNNPNSIWTHNDSGDKARIYQIDTLGNLLRTLNLKNTTAIDCEELTQDIAGNYYLGDFGNNLNDRTDLRIYKIPNPDIIVGDSVEPQFICFSYPDQDSFPPSIERQNFDCEAMFHFNNHLYLFSKNRGTSPYSKMYRLPDTAGVFVAELVDSIYTNKRITSADISPDGNTLALLAENNIWLINEFTGSNFLAGNIHQIKITHTQKEAIVFVDDTTVYMTDERVLGINGNLYRLYIGSWLTGINDIENKVQINIYPNPAKDKIRLICNNYLAENSLVEISDMMGKPLITVWMKTKHNSLEIDVSMLKTGVYYLSIKQKNRIIKSEKLLIQ